MKAISLNVRGFGKSKGVDIIGLVRNLIAKEKPCFLALQDSKLNCINGKWVMALWGSEECDFIQKTKVGKSGGQLLIWNTDQFVATEVIEFDSVIGIKIVTKRGYCVETSMRGRLFTLVSDDGVKFSKLDRFFITEKFCTLWENLSVVTLERRHSDHCPIVLKDEEKNFGPKPFKVFDAWFDEKDVDQVKEALRKWSYNRFGDLEGEIDRLKGAASELEIRAESGGLNESEIKIWQDTHKLWLEKEAIRTNMLKQKARSGYDRPSLEELKNQVLSTDEACALESPFNEKEIQKAILECDSTKAPGPDGFNMRFFKKYWDVIKAELVDAIMWFWDKAEFSKGGYVIDGAYSVTDVVGVGNTDGDAGGFLFFPVSLLSIHSSWFTAMT
ncbi:uncharacterized protein [Rutidosis leptorrhynchoides]|uniref:uncharacterized protein n=1 Tax=Rutidosis leptorrhynchoides TaxID=125765 RepID=UPI003A994020